MQSHSDLTTGNSAALIFKFVLPLYLGNICQQLYNICDTVIVGRFVGQNALAAVGSTGTIMFLINGVASGMGTGFTVLSSQRYGSDDEDGVRRSVANGILLSFGISILLTLLCLAIMKPVLRLMNTPEDIFDDALIYIMVISCGFICVFFYNLLSALLRAVGNSRMPLIILVVTSFLNIILDLFLIVGAGMGTGGAALATVLSQGISSILCIIYIVRKVPVLRPGKGMWHPDWGDMKEQLRVGVPMALQFGITASGSVMMQSAINLFGSTAVAAVTVSTRIHNVLSQGDYAMGQTMVSYCGQNYGAKCTERLRKGVHDALGMMSLYSIACGIITMAILEPVMSLFFVEGTDLEAMLPYARIYSLCCALFYIFLGFVFVFRNSMQGCGYGLYPMLGGVVELVCRVVLAVAAIHTMNFVLACLCNSLAWVGAGVFDAICWHFVYRKIDREWAEQEDTM